MDQSQINAAPHRGETRKQNGSARMPLPSTDAAQRDELIDFIENAEVAMHWVAEDGTIIWANAAEMNLLGYSRDEYVGRNITEFHVDSPVIGDILQRLKNDEKLKGYEARLRCKDGTIRYVSINSSVYRRNGEFVHTGCVTLDLGHQKQVDEIQQRLGAIVESSDDAIIGKNLQGIILSWNRGAERIFGYTKDEIIGRHISTLAAPERVDEIPNILDRIRRGERIEHYLTRRKTKDGRILTISLTVSPIRDASGNVIGASKVARDVTERERHERDLREANETLTQANADLQQFTYSASHDLQEPLRMVSTYSELLVRRFGDVLGAEGKEYLGYTLQGARRMDQLLKDLRAYTLASTQGKEPTESIDAGAVVDKALENLQSVIRSGGVKVTRTALPKIWMLEFQCEQIFQNLIGNAIRYRRAETPEIHITAVRQDQNWLFSVADNGIGIDQQYKEQIFDLFKRLHSIAEYPGTGMGLAICKRVVERAGGGIWVESEPGRGSTFFFTIPDKRR